MPDRVTYSLVNESRAVELDPVSTRKFLKAAGMTGTGMAPRAINSKSSVRGGSKFRGSRRQGKTIDLPIVTFGDDRADIESKLDELVLVFADEFTTPYLVATYPDGRQFQTEVHYVSGGDHQWGSSDTDGRNYVRWPLQLLAPTPLWEATAATTFTVTTSGGGRGLIRTGGGGLSRMRVSSSQALGTLTVTNGGHVASKPTWTLVGPLTSFQAIRPVDGAKLQYGAAIAAGTTVTIDTTRNTITDQDGNNLFGGLVGAPKFFTIPPGQTTLTVSADGATSATKITGSFRELREVIF